MLTRTTVASSNTAMAQVSSKEQPTHDALHSSPPYKTLHSNQPFCLEDPDTLWQVQTGTLALFALPQTDPDLRGRRRYLFNVKAGDLIIPATLLGLAVPCDILAIALDPVELLALSPADLNHQFQTEPETKLAQIEAWVYQLSRSLANYMPPELTTPLGDRGLLGPGEAYCPPAGQVVWLQVLHGDGQLLGQPSLAIQPSPMPLILSAHLWIESTTILEVDRIQPRPEQWLSSLRQFHQQVFCGLQQLERDQLQAECQRFHARISLNQTAVSQTLSNFSTVLQPASQRSQKQQSIPVAQTMLEAHLMAAGAIGRALGIEIHGPAQADGMQTGELIEAIARASHIRIRAVTLKANWWKQDSGPIFAYREDTRQPVALLPRSETCYDVFDPSQGTRQRCTARQAGQLAASAYSFYRPLPHQVNLLSLLRFVARGNRKEFLLVLLTGITVTLLGMVPPQLTGLLIDQAIPSADFLLLMQMTLGLMATAMGTTLFQLSQSIALMRLETRADSNTQAAVWDRLLKLKTSFFRQYAIGDLSSRVSAVSQIRQKLGNTILKSLFSSVFALLNLGLLFYYSPLLACVALVVAFINIGVTITSSLLTLKKIRPLLEEQGKLFGMLVQLIGGISKFRVAGAEPRAYAYWGKQYSHQLKLLLGTESIEDNLTVINSLLSALTPAILFGFATGLLQSSQAEGGGFTTGTFLAFNTAFGTFIGGATSLSTTVIDVLEVLPIWQRAQPILQAQPEVHTDKAEPGRLSGQISVKHVVFRYRPDGVLNLDNVSIHADPGEFIALVGPSGSGKSTLLRLLLGFESPESGVVAFDGQDLAGVDVSAVRRQLGVVLQNSRLMSAPIFENISSNALISMDEAWEAARMAGFADDIVGMPMGMHTIVSEGGTNLSGGQRQRLLIARALALRPRVLLFDEATSALDNRTQAIVSESLDRLKVTRIVVAHRLSTIRNADRIYVMEAGRVVEIGDFESLAIQGGLFSQLIQRQRV